MDEVVGVGARSSGEEGVVPRAVCAVPGDGLVADGASGQGRRRRSVKQRRPGRGAADGGLGWRREELNGRVCSL